MFSKKCLKIGLITMACGVLGSFGPALYLYFSYGVIPNGSQMTSIISMLIAAFLVGWIVQPITFYPAIGIGASCISWLTGNVADLRAPAITAAQKTAEVEPGTPESDVLSTMAVATTTFVVVAVLTIFTLVGNWLIGILPESVTSAFAYITPAVFGAIVMDYIMKNYKYNALLVVAGFIVFVILKAAGLQAVWITLLVVVSGAFVSRGCYNFIAKKKGSQVGSS